MITIGLIGRIGAGKSTVARRFGERGATVIDADALAHEVLAEPDVRAEIAARFGPGVLSAAGGVDRARLAEAVFGSTPAHAAALAALEAIVHPRVHRRIEAALAAAREAAEAAGRPDEIVVLDVPLLVRAGWDRVCDHLVVVECEDAVRRERLARRGVSPEQQAAREAAWEAGSGGASPQTAASARVRATLAVDTSQDLAYTHSQVDRIVGELRHR
ncbi:MAG: dephospho-CoA kinase [Planctomycetia bacterium]